MRRYDKRKNATESDYFWLAIVAPMRLGFGMDRQPHPRIVAFADDCARAGLDPLTVLAEAGVHRSHWFRWRSGEFSPSLKNLDRVTEALARMAVKA